MLARHMLLVSAIAALASQALPAIAGSGSTPGAPPEPAFTWTEPTVSRQVHFDGGATTDAEDAPEGADGSPLQLVWDLGDGTDAKSGVEVTHTYNAPGTFPVTLTVTDTDGNTATLTRDVVVANHAPTAVLAPPSTGKVSGDQVAFDASGSEDPDEGDVLTYDWDFGDGTTRSDGGPTPTHTYAMPGTYVVAVTVTDETGADATATREIEIGNAAPSAAFTVSPGTVRTLDKVTFDASATTDPDTPDEDLVASWDFGDGSGSATGLVVTHTYQGVGTRTVTLTVTDDGGNTSTTTRQVEVHNAPPRLVINPNPKTRPGKAVTIDASRSFDPEGGPLTFSWSTPGGSPSSGNGSSHAVTYGAEGRFGASVTLTDAAGATTHLDFVVLVDHDLVFRLSGRNRIDTSVALAGGAFERADTVVLARADAFPDALAASALAAVVDGPILLTGRDGLYPSVVTELQRLGATTAYLAGGTSALSEQVEADLAAHGVRSRRLAGADRFATAVAIADEVVRLSGPVDQVVVALGAHPTRDAWPDALVAGNVATIGRAPVLLALHGEVPASTRDGLRRLAPGRVWIAGGEAAVGRSADAQLRADGFAPRRLAGPNRYGTAVALVEEARRQGAGLEPTVVASGRNFPDALAASVVAWKLGGSLLLVDPTNLFLSDPVRGWFEFQREGVDTVFIAGGHAAVGGMVEAQIHEEIQDRPPR